VGIAVDDAARKLECTVRAIWRDLQGLERAGFRLYDDKAADGRWSIWKLEEDFKLGPIADQIESGTYLLYDGASGTDGMLTVAKETLQQLAREHGKEVATHLYGQEINAETYAICEADLLLKGEGDAADNIVGAPEHSTLANDAFSLREFDLMLSNPPYGKSWSTDLERMGGKDGLKDPRLLIEHGGDAEYMLSKMKHGTAHGSRIAEVHNGSSLFTGDAGQGESNIRRGNHSSHYMTRAS
jgi:type I restriction enzyme M protein